MQQSYANDMPFLCVFFLCFQCFINLTYMFMCLHQTLSHCQYQVTSSQVITYDGVDKDFLFPLLQSKQELLVAHQDDIAPQQSQLYLGWPSFVIQFTRCINICFWSFWLTAGHLSRSCHLPGLQVDFFKVECKSKGTGASWCLAAIITLPWSLTWLVLATGSLWGGIKHFKKIRRSTQEQKSLRDQVLQAPRQEVQFSCLQGN